MDDTQLSSETKSLVAQCATVPCVRSDSDYRAAGELLKTAAAFVREVKAYFAPLKKQASDMHKSICAKESAALSDAEQASGRLRKLIADYQTELDRAARMERERIEAEQRAERERIEAEIAAQNLTPVEQAERLEAVEGVQERQIQAQISAPPKVSGVSMRRIPDVAKIAAHVAEHGDAEPIPGVYVWKEWQFRVANTDLLPEEFTRYTTTVRS